jgi:hypothetical protein
MIVSRRSGMAFLRRSVVLIAAIATTTAASASASVTQPSIEGVWSFNGGTVIVAPNESGQLVGTVASPTVLAVCTHPVGQAMWTDLQPAADGSYTGLHQWYHGTGANCSESKLLGPAAFRVLTESDGSRFLEVCFNTPGTTTPDIASDGTPVNVNVGCTESTPVSGVPTSAPTFSESIQLPPTGPTVCLSRRDFIIHVREPKGDPFVKLRVFVGTRVFKTVRDGQYIKATIDLRGLPKGTYTVKIRARTAAGFLVKGSRTYHTCVPKK